MNIWNEVEKCGEFADWTLRLVGTGEDLPRYKRFVAQNKLKQVVFEGAQQSEDFYKRSSIFMLTSQSEGWGLTLTEAQQNGCVPIAFDTYDSLHEIITDGNDGFIITKGRLDIYVNHLKDLMRDKDTRYKMAQTAIETSHRFEQTKIAKQWYKILNDIKKNEK